MAIVIIKMLRRVLVTLPKLHLHFLSVVFKPDAHDFDVVLLEQLPDIVFAKSAWCQRFSTFCLRRGKLSWSACY
jgi:hypothetical protein